MRSYSPGAFVTIALWKSAPVPPSVCSPLAVRANVGKENASERLPSFLPVLSPLYFIPLLFPFPLFLCRGQSPFLRLSLGGAECQFINSTECVKARIYGANGMN